MRASKQASTHQLLVNKIINEVQDRDIQEEMLIINKQYRQAIAGLRLAVGQLREIDETTGTEHDEIITNIVDLIKQTKESEINLHEMSAHFTNDYQEEETK